MAGWSQTIIVGNVGRVDELKYLQSGVPVISFSVAVTKKWTDKTTNEKKEKTTWYRCTAWRQLAETANSYIKKGAQVMVVGQVEARAYADNSGQPAASLELTADTFQLLGSRADGSQPQGSYEGSSSGGASGGAPPESDSDIPF